MSILKEYLKIMKPKEEKKTVKNRMTWPATTDSGPVTLDGLTSATTTGDYNGPITTTTGDPTTIDYEALRRSFSSINNEGITMSDVHFSTLPWSDTISVLSNNATIEATYDNFEVDSEGAIVTRDRSGSDTYRCQWYPYRRGRSSFIYRVVQK